MSAALWIGTLGNWPRKNAYGLLSFTSTVFGSTTVVVETSLR
jgi:hypothetical protein